MASFCHQSALIASTSPPWTSLSIPNHHRSLSVPQTFRCKNPSSVGVGTNPSSMPNLSVSVSQRQRTFFRCSNLLSLPSKNLVTEPEPLFTSVKCFAPATVTNLGCPFSFAGCAVDEIGDFVTLRVNPEVRPGKVSIDGIIDRDDGIIISSNSSAANKQLSKNPLQNTAGKAVIAVMKMLNIQSIGLSLTLEKGLPLDRGLGSSAASAAAAAVAANEIFGGPLSLSDPVLAGRLSLSEDISCYHSDNVATAIMGGLVVFSGFHPWNLSQ